METNTPTTNHRHDEGAVSANKMMLAASFTLLVIAAVALAFLWHHTSTKEATIEREKNDIKLERQIAREEVAQQDAIAAQTRDDLPTIASEPAAPKEQPKPAPSEKKVAKAKPKPARQSAPAAPKAPADKAPPAAKGHKSWKRYTATSNHTYNLDFLFAHFNKGYIKYY